MKKNGFSEVSLRAAAVAGAAAGLFLWLFAMPLGMSTMMGSGFGYYGMMGYMMGYAYPGYGFTSVVIGAIFGAAAGAIIAAVYNWALKLK